MPSFATTSTEFDLNKYNKDIRQTIVKQILCTCFILGAFIIMVLSGRSILLSHGKGFCLIESNQNINKMNDKLPNGLYIPMIQ